MSRFGSQLSALLFQFLWLQIYTSSYVSVLPLFYVGEINSGALADVVYVICGAVVL
jgi:hypothetical protein